MEVLKVKYIICTRLRTKASHLLFYKLEFSGNVFGVDIFKNISKLKIAIGSADIMIVEK